MNNNNILPWIPPGAALPIPGPSLILRTDSSSSGRRRHEQEASLDMDDMEETGADGKKMTDEEKRKNFLERNRSVLSCLNSVPTLTVSQSRRAQMSPAQEAMAG